MMDVAVERLREDGYRQGILWSLAGYERGRGFYEALGWEPDGAVRDAGRQVRFRHELTSRSL